MSAMLEKELTVYREKQAELVNEASGKFVVICGDEVSAPWETYSDALQSGYQQFGLRPFLVKKIEEVEQVHYLGQVLGPSSCQK
jgi:hypothetical protein